MTPQTDYCLLDIPGLERLADVCSRFSVELAAHGGLVRRLALHLASPRYSGQGPPDVFDLCPFSSDIDLIHDGDESLTPRILEAVLEFVPNAESFRWELRSRRRQARFDATLRHCGIIPVSLMRLSSVPGSGISDPWSGWADIQHNKFRYLRNGFYSNSRLYRAGRDLEIFSALIYMLTLAEAGVTEQSLNFQPGIDEAKKVVDEATNVSTVIALQSSAYLRARMLYLLAKVLAAASHVTASALLKRIGFDDFLTYLRGYFPPSFESSITALQAAEQVLVSSAHLGGDFFRLPHTTESWDHGSTAAREADQACQQAHCELPDPQVALMVSPWIPVNAGPSLASHLSDVAEASRPVVDASEFAYIRVPISASGSALADIDDVDLSVLLAIGHAPVMSLPNAQIVVSQLLPIPAVCSRVRLAASVGPEEYVLIRCSCLGVLELAARGGLKPKVRGTDSPFMRLFLVAWRPGEPVAGQT